MQYYYSGSGVIKSTSGGKGRKAVILVVVKLFRVLMAALGTILRTCSCVSHNNDIEKPVVLLLETVIVGRERF